ncbi:MAG TPA: hypothetical protein VEJ18_17525 [Planctomycetota bacterium]|nr:hypothetical protein [Planctomycetota bacterium]
MRGWAWTAVVSLFLGGALGAQDDAAKEEAKKLDEQAKARLAEFKKEYRTAKTDQERADKIAGLSALGSPKHPRILDELKTYLRNPVPEIAIAAAEQVAKYEKNKDAADALMSAASARREKDVIVKCVRYVGDVGYRGVTSKVVGLFRHKEVDVAREAVDTCAKLKAKDSVDPLLALWRELEQIKDDKDPNGGIGGGLGGGLGGGGVAGTNSIGDEQRKRKETLTPAVEDALGKISGETFKNLKEAQDWWRRAKSTFKDPE